MSSFTVVDHIPAILAQLRTATGAIVAETAAQITREYASTAAIRTGFMRSSAYTVTHDATTYGANLTGQGPMLPAVDKPADMQTALAAVAAEYAAYLEYGTRNMNAQPAFLPAVDKAKAYFEHEMSELEQRVKG